jgi:hypothetical protein
VKRIQQRQSPSLADRPTRSHHPIRAPFEYPVPPVTVPKWHIIGPGDHSLDGTQICRAERPANGQLVVGV